MRTLLTGTVLLLGVIAFLSGCEEVAAPKPVSKPPPDERPAQLYTEIRADELLERWTVLPNGAVAAAVANLNGRRLAAATDGFSGLSQHFTFHDAREYGACVVFTVIHEYPVSPGNAGPEGPPEVRTDNIHIIDCVGAAAPGNAVDGLFHAAHMCVEFTDINLHVLRAGNFNPTTHVHDIRDFIPDDPLYGTWVHTRVADYADSMQWYKYITPVEGAAPILVNWAALGSGRIYEDDVLVHSWGGSTAGFDTLNNHQEDLQFSIDHSVGVVDVEPNDGAAFAEYQRRCQTGTDSN